MDCGTGECGKVVVFFVFVLVMYVFIVMFDCVGVCGVFHSCTVAIISSSVAYLARLCHSFHSISRHLSICVLPHNGTIKVLTSSVFRLDSSAIPWLVDTLDENDIVPSMPPALEPMALVMYFVLSHYPVCWD